MKARYHDDAGYPVPSLPYPTGPVVQSMPPRPKLVYHFSADSGVYSDVAGTVPAVNNGDAVALWRNQGNDENAVQNTAARRPTFKTGGLNGKPYLQCDKTTQQYFEDLPLWEGTASLDTYSRAIFAVVEDVDVTARPRLSAAPSR